MDTDVSLSTGSPPTQKTDDRLLKISVSKIIFRECFCLIFYQCCLSLFRFLHLKVLGSEEIFEDFLENFNCPRTKNEVILKPGTTNGLCGGLHFCPREQKCEMGRKNFLLEMGIEKSHFRRTVS
jgi:hypothetical protein